MYLMHSTNRHNLAQYKSTQSLTCVFMAMGEIYCGLPTKLQILFSTISCKAGFYNLYNVQCTLINILDSPNIFSEAAIWATTKIPHPGECFWHSSVISVTFFLFWTYCAKLLFSVALSVMRYKSLLQCNAGSRPQLQPVARGGHCLKYSQGRTIQYSSPGAPHCPTPTYIYLGNQN